MRLQLAPLTLMVPLLSAIQGRNALVYQRLFWGALAGALAAILLGESPYLESLELSMLKWRYQVSNQVTSMEAPATVSRDVAIVAFDDSSQFDLGIAHFNDARCQGILAEALSAIEKGEPTLVAVDLDLRSGVNPSLVKLLRRHRNIVLSLFGSLEGTGDLPAAEYMTHAASYGYNELTRESNGVVYRLPVNFQTLGSEGKNDAFAPVKSFTEAITDVHRNIRGVGPPSGSLVSNSDQPVYINFKGVKYPQESFQEVLSPKFDARRFKDKIVIIGSTLTGRRDDPWHLRTPLGEMVPEVQVQADAVETLLDNEAVFSLSRFISRYLLLVLAAVFGACFSILPLGLRTALLLSGVLILLLVSQLSFQIFHIAIPAVPPLAVLFSGFVLGTVIYLDTDLRRRNKELAQARQDMQVRAENERQRIAEDLHDETLPALSAVARMADRLSEDLGENPVPRQMREKLDAAVTEMRRVINDLHPSVLETMGFVPALENLVGILTRDSEIEGHFAGGAHNGEYDLSLFTKLQLYRIVQEALNNVQKHAHASRIEVEIVQSGATLTIVIADNGSGIDPKMIRADSHGLVNIKQRAQLIGASVDWRKPRSFPSGTEVVVRIPLSEDKP